MEATAGPESPLEERRSMKNGKRILSVTIKHIQDESPDTSWLDEYASSPTSDFSIDRAHSADCPVVNPTRPDLKEDYTITHVFAEGEEFCEDCGKTKSEAVAVLCSEYDSSDDCDCSGGDMERNEYRYFNPSFNYVDKAGKPTDGLTPDEVRKYVRQDYERMESLHRGDWYFLGIKAEAEIAIPNSQSINLGDGVPYFDSIVQQVHSGGLWGIESDSAKDCIVEEEKNQLSELRDQLRALGFSTRAISKAFQTVEREDS